MFLLFDPNTHVNAFILSRTTPIFCHILFQEVEETSSQTEVVVEQISSQTEVVVVEQSASQTEVVVEQISSQTEPQQNYVDQLGALQQQVRCQDNAPILCSISRTTN